jgi:hypothetical protein
LIPLLQEIFAVFVAVALYEIVSALVMRWRNRRFDLGCDACERVAPLKITPDKSGYLCRNCMKRYLIEHRDTLTEEEIHRSKFGYRKRRK